MYVNHNPGDTVASGTTVQVTCQPSYKPVNGFIDSITCRQGWWDKLPRPCQSSKCLTKPRAVPLVRFQKGGSPLHLSITD